VYPIRPLRPRTAHCLSWGKRDLESCDQLDLSLPGQPVVLRHRHGVSYRDLRDTFLVGGYTDPISDIDLPKVRKFFSDDLRYAKRWMFFVKALGGYGAFVVCGARYFKTCV
jgi:hypothetical protein